MFSADPIYFYSFFLAFTLCFQFPNFTEPRVSILTSQYTRIYLKTCAYILLNPKRNGPFSSHGMRTKVENAWYFEVPKHTHTHASRSGKRRNSLYCSSATHSPNQPNQPNAKQASKKKKKKKNIKKMNLLRSLFPWQHRIVLMMFLPSRQAGLGRITAQIGAPWLVTKGGFRTCRQRNSEREKEREKEAQMVGRIATLKKTPTHTHNWVLQYWFEWMEGKKT